MIECVAIRTDDGQVYKEKMPARHIDIEVALRRCGVDMKFAERGFITDGGQWLRRKPAARHAVKCGQVPRDKINWNLGLFSEDLW